MNEEAEARCLSELHGMQCLKRPHRLGYHCHIIEADGGRYVWWGYNPLGTPPELSERKAPAPPIPVGSNPAYPRKTQDVDMQPQRKVSQAVQAVLDAKVQGYEGDACTLCGNLTMVRNGSCTKCQSCGETSGCS